MRAPGAARFAPDWLALREQADTAARATGLLDPLRAHLVAAGTQPFVIRDLGCGTGSLARWLVGRLDGPQHWVLHDHDPDLLAHAWSSMPERAADGAPVTAETREADVADLRAGDLVGTSLVVASALLDVLTADEIDTLADACADARCPALVCLTVVGRVVLEPADPLDAEFAAAFNAHQRRRIGGRRLLGPDAVARATEAFTRRGAVVHTASSPWRLDADQAGLMREWLRGWVAAALEQWPTLGAHAEPYLRRRLDACADGELRVEVDHADLLALPDT